MALFPPDEKLTCLDEWTYGEKEMKTFPLLSMDIKTEPLRYRDIGNATATLRDAFLDDPLAKYLKDGKTNNSMVRRVVLRAIVAAWIETKTFLSVQHGNAVVIAQSTAPKKRIHRVVEPIVAALNAFLKSLQNSEQRKRGREYEEKSKMALQECIGDRVKDLWTIEGLCTSPEFQGRGYGSALLEAILTLVDQEGRDAWLISSNIQNETFYISHGFLPVKDIYMGEDNPNWKQDPVVIQLMIRTAKSRNPDDKSYNMSSGGY